MEQISGSCDIHSEGIKKVREKAQDILQKFPFYDTDFALLRFLRANNHDVDKAAEKLTRSLHALNAVGIFDKDMSTIENIQKCVRSVSPAAEYFPGGILGYDKNGYLAMLHNVGSLDPRSLVGCGRVSELYIGAFYECEGMQSLIRAEEARQGRKLGVLVIVDLSAFSFDVMFHIPATKIYINALTMIQETLENFEILGPDWKEVLMERHGAQCLPKSYGGLADESNLRRGGEVPEEVKQQVVKVYYEPEQLVKITLSARQIIEIPIEITKANVKLFWYFTCSYGDLDFSIIFNDIEVWPQFRITTEFLPEFGETVCRERGTYKVIFSNRHGHFRKKQIHYKLEIVDCQ